MIGGGGHAKVVISILKKLRNYQVFGYVDTIDKGDVLDIPYVGQDDGLIELAKKQDVTHAVIAIGQNKEHTKRYALFQQMSGMGLIFPVIVSPNAIINENVEIGEGTVVMDGVIVNSGSHIGRFCILNTNASVDHDCKIGDFVHVAPGAVLAGGVQVGSYSLIGAGSAVNQYKKIANNCIIGSGAVIIRDCSKSGTYVGVPAKLQIAK